MKFAYFIPIISFMIPTIISTCFMIPRERKMVVSFSVCLFFMALTYLYGIQTVVQDLTK